MNKIFCISRVTAQQGEYRGFVIVAENEDSVRQLAAMYSAEEGRWVWLNPETKCVCVGIASDDQVTNSVILSAYQD